MLVTFLSESLTFYSANSSFPTPQQCSWVNHSLLTRFFFFLHIQSTSVAPRSHHLCRQSPVCTLQWEKSEQPDNFRLPSPWTLPDVLPPDPLLEEENIEQIKKKVKKNDNMTGRERKWPTAFLLMMTLAPAQAADILSRSFQWWRGSDTSPAAQVN